MIDWTNNQRNDKDEYRFANTSSRMDLLWKDINNARKTSEAAKEEYAFELFRRFELPKMLYPKDLHMQITYRGFNRRFS